MMELESQSIVFAISDSMQSMAKPRTRSCAIVDLLYISH